MSADAADAGYAAVYRFAALHRAFRRARRAKRGRGGEPAFYRDLEDNLLALSDALRARTFRPDPYRYFHLRGHKDRVVAGSSRERSASGRRDGGVSAASSARPSGTRSRAAWPTSARWRARPACVR